MKYKLAVMIPTYNQPLLQKAVDSVPIRDDVLVVVCDDGSTPVSDGVFMLPQHSKNLKARKNLVVLDNEVNKGPGAAMNTILDYLENVDVEYLVRLDSDDYFLSGINETIDDNLTGEDMIYYDLRMNDGTLIKMVPERRHVTCGAVKFWRKDFVGSTRYPEIYYGEDWHFNEELLNKGPTEKYLNEVLYYYNYPRSGSLSDKKKH